MRMQFIDTGSREMALKVRPQVGDLVMVFGYVGEFKVIQAGMKYLKVQEIGNKHTVWVKTKDVTKIANVY